MDYRDWHVGMKIVCIAKKPSHVDADAVYPEVGRVYTIRELRDDAPWGGKSVVVLLVELDNKHFIGRTTLGGHCYVEPGFNPKGFRRVQKRKTDISIFTALLTKAPTPEKEPA